MSLSKDEADNLAKADEVEALVSQGYTHKQIAKKLNIAPSTVHRRKTIGATIRDRIGVAAKPTTVERKDLPSFDRWDMPGEKPDDLGYDDLDDDIPIEDLINDRKERFKRLDGKKTRRHTRRVQVKLPGPVAITHFGDPHVDDDGCNWPELLRTVEVVSKTEGMFAGNIGDTTNNWVGRLQRLWGHQSTTVDEAIRLAHWLFHSVPWMYCVLGNHDKWNHGAQLLRYLTQGAKIAVFAENTARVELEFPKGDPLRVVARHDFKGSSIWNRAHGPLRESKLNPWGDIYISGHRHIWVSHHEEGTDGKPRHALIVRGFKAYDEYAETLGFYEHQHGESVTTILDPTHPSPMQRVQVVWDVEEAADILTWKRGKYGLTSYSKRTR